MSNKEKYTAIVAFSTPSGLLHVGHALGQVAGHTTALYESLKQGKEVFFPFGIHATGKDTIRIIEDIKKGIDPAKYGVSSDLSKKLLSEVNIDECVDNLIGYYKTKYLDDLKKLGIDADEKAYFSTHDGNYHKFTQWTIRKLNEKGLIVKTFAQRPYCEDCGEVKAIEQDESEAFAKEKVSWSEVRIENGEILGGEFYCKVHKDKKITVHDLNENAINYADSDYQEITIDKINRHLKVYPKQYSSELEDIIRTRHEKPMERKKGGNIGTPSPYSKDAVIEALSDSNIYMEYFAVAKILNEGLIKKDALGDALFDYLFLDKGADCVGAETGLSEENLREVKQFIEQNSTIDLNVAGFEHKSVHFPFFLFTHAAILPDKYFPKEIILTSHVMRGGEKMSKSKGNVLYLSDILSKIKEQDVSMFPEGAEGDTLRFYLMSAQSLDKDVDWSDELFYASGLNRIKKYAVLIDNVSDKKTGNFEFGRNEAWLSTKAHMRLREGLAAFDAREYRTGIVSGFDKLNADIKKYITLAEQDKGINVEFLKQVLGSQLKFMYPVMPRITNALFQKVQGDKINELSDYSTFEKNMDAYDAVEIETDLNGFIGERIGFINSRTGMMKGKNIIDSNKPIEIYVSSAASKNVLENAIVAKSKILKDLNYNLIIDPDCEFLKLEHNGNVFYI